jgi:SAM-dependent methyltransferase
MIEAAEQPRALLSWMEQLADSTRLRLLRLLERRELGVAELCDIVQMPQSTVSRHLKLLVGGGWLRQRRQGTANLYRMSTSELDSPAKRLWLLAREQVSQTPLFRQDELRLGRVLEQRGGDTAAFFAGAAGRWDKLRGELYGDRFTHEAVLGLLPRRWTVLDLGCGTGELAAALAPHVARVIGIDQSEAMLRAARRRTKDVQNVELRRGSLEALELDDGSCDAALMVLVLTYVTDVEAVLREAARVLCSGGRLVVVDLLRHDSEDFRSRMGQRCAGFEAAHLLELCRSSGLTSCSARTLPPEPGVKGPALLMAEAQKTEEDS